ncbi:MAG: hypothetical protein IGS48_03735 [Oscillatoriales cyanobacterium C42_A2020_001]|nr:hypothetical protein [Leptolyngbyaceae cyanobacterium C42_A2020_001]
MPPEPHVSIASFACALSDLVAHSKQTGNPETIFSLEEPLFLSIKVEFSGSGAIALMPLQLSILVEFYAKARKRSEDLELGSATLPTRAKQFIYTPTLAIPIGLGSLAVLPDKAYTISALVRIGAKGHPALITGFVEGLFIQTYE